MKHYVSLQFITRAHVWVTDEQIKKYKGSKTNLEAICEEIATNNYDFDTLDFNSDEFDFDDAFYQYEEEEE